jgi:hypothetical protein
MRCETMTGQQADAIRQEPRFRAWIALIRQGERVPGQEGPLGFATEPVARCSATPTREAIRRSN